MTNKVLFSLNRYSGRIKMKLAREYARYITSKGNIRQWVDDIKQHILGELALLNGEQKQSLESQLNGIESVFAGGDAGTEKHVEQLIRLCLDTVGVRGTKQFFETFE
jgi:hypothetical protein